LWKNNFAFQFNIKGMGYTFSSFVHIYKIIRTKRSSKFKKRDYEKLSVKEDTEIAHFLNNREELIPVNKCEANSLVVFDDCVNEQQQHIIRYYFSRGLHKNISCVYLTQSYMQVSRGLIRNNINFLCLYQQSLKYTKDIYNEYIGSDFTFEEIKAICNSCWRANYGF